MSDSLTYFSPPEPSSWHPSLLCIWRQLVPVCQVFLLNLHPPLLGHVRYTLRCLVAVPQDTDCVTTIKSTEEKLANKKKELETFQVLHLLKVWDQNYFLFCTYFLQSEFCEIKKKYDAARERLENDVKEITELIQVCHFTSSKLVNFYAPSSQGERRCIHRLPRCLCVEVQPCTFSFQVCIFA